MNKFNIKQFDFVDKNNDNEIIVFKQWSNNFYENKIFDFVDKNNDNEIIVFKQWSNDFYKNKMLDFIKSVKQKKIIFLLPQEVNFHGYFSINEYKKINDSAKSLDKYIIACLGGISKKKNFSNLKFLEWSSVLFFSRMIMQNNNIESKLILEEKNKFTSLTSLIAHKEFRIDIYEKLFKMNLLEKYKNINFSYFENGSSDKQEKKIFINNKLNLLNKIGNQYIPDDFYLFSLFDIVCESSGEEFFLTEKSLRPIYFKKPFLVVSCYGFHNKMKKYNFELYTEIIDYSFDKERNKKIRIQMIADEIKRIDEKYSIKDIYNLTKDKVEINFNILLRISKKKWEPLILNDFFWSSD